MNTKLCLNDICSASDHRSDSGRAREAMSDEGRTQDRESQYREIQSSKFKVQVRAGKKNGSADSGRVMR